MMDPTRSFRAELESLDLQQVQVLSLDQIQAIRACNNYVDRPLGPQPGLRRSQSHTQAGQASRLTRSSTTTSFTSRASASSDQRLLSGLSRSPSTLGSALRSQPKAELKPAASLGKGHSEVELEAEFGPHMLICERCARCKCVQCCSRRRLPSCWALGGRCECSPHSVLEGATCLCCVKGLFYHCCDQEEEEGCADRPCSCSHGHAYARWSVMGLLALCLPCLCCYPPGHLCLALCQRVYDHATRPGCRCINTNTVCRKISASDPLRGTVALQGKAPEKPL